MNIELYGYASVAHHRRVKAGSKFVFCVLLLACSRRQSRTMTSAPVARCINEALPEEVFAVIFEEHAKMEWGAPVIDGRVCRQWRQTILHSPRAWAYLQIRYSCISAHSTLQQWLDRSVSVPLHILLKDWIRGAEEALNEHCKRIKSISLYGDYLAYLGHQSFPILQSLTIKAKYTDRRVFRWNACRVMPELHSLRATNISVDALPSNVFPALRVLALYRVKYCNFIIQNSYHSLTSLMLAHISLRYTSEPLEFVTNISSKEADANRHIYTCYEYKLQVYEYMYYR